MSWVKLDDKFANHPKVLVAWQGDPRAVGLHALALSWVAGHTRDGHVSPEFVRQMMPAQRDRARAIETLTEAGLWEPNGEGWLIHDYLDYNPSRRDVERRRKSERDKKRRQRVRS